MRTGRVEGGRGASRAVYARAHDRTRCDRGRGRLREATGPVGKGHRPIGDPRREGLQDRRQGPDRRAARSLHHPFRRRHVSGPRSRDAVGARLRATRDPALEGRQPQQGLPHRCPQRCREAGQGGRQHGDPPEGDGAGTSRRSRALLRSRPVGCEPAGRRRVQPRIGRGPCWRHPQGWRNGRARRARIRAGAALPRQGAEGRSVHEQPRPREAARRRGVGLVHRTPGDERGHVRRGPGLDRHQRDELHERPGLGHAAGRSDRAQRDRAEGPRGSRESARARS